jgi:hypothetical protein
MEKCIARGIDGPIEAGTVADAIARSRRIRADALARASGSDYEAARLVGEEVARERQLRAEEARGGATAVLRELSRSQSIPAPQPQTHKLLGVAGDVAAMGEHFVRKAAETVLDVAEPRPEAASWTFPGTTAPGTTVRFAEGIHTMSWGSVRSMRTFPEDVTICGAGMDRTLVRLADELDPNVAVLNLTFRDLTIDCGDNYLTDLRSTEPVTIRMERCRVTGFDMGAGGSVMLAARTAAFHATDCRFEAGFGRTDPGCGNVFRVESLVARLERCTFVGPFRSVFTGAAGETIVFAGCTFERGALSDPAVLDAPPYGIRFESCAVVNPLAKDERPTKRPLSALNPAWPSKTR